MRFFFARKKTEQKAVVSKNETFQAWHIALSNIRKLNIEYLAQSITKTHVRALSDRCQLFWNFPFQPVRIKLKIQYVCLRFACIQKRNGNNSYNSAIITTAFFLAFIKDF